MDIAVSEQIEQWPEGLGLVQNATRRLEEILGSSSRLVSGRWDRTRDESGRDLIVLHLSDFNGRVTGQFAPDELRSPSQTAFRLYRLWGDLLHVGSRRMLEALAVGGGDAAED